MMKKKEKNEVIENLPIEEIIDFITWTAVDFFNETLEEVMEILKEVMEEIDLEEEKRKEVK